MPMSSILNFLVVVAMILTNVSAALTGTTAVQLSVNNTTPTNAVYLPIEYVRDLSGDLDRSDQHFARLVEMPFSAQNIQPRGYDQNRFAVPLQQGLSDLVVTTSMTLAAGTYNFNNVTVTNGSTLALLSNLTYSTGVTITAQNMFVDLGARISADGRGFGSAAGWRPGESGNDAGGGGYGGFGGIGGAWNNVLRAGGEPFGSVFYPQDLGSGGGGSGYQVGGSGGGAITLIVSSTLLIRDRKSVV